VGPPAREVLVPVGTRAPATFHRYGEKEGQRTGT
jgi:hypothetical protein